VNEEEGQSDGDREARHHTRATTEQMAWWQQLPDKTHATNDHANLLRRSVFEGVIHNKQQVTHKS
jgi:hypothetical protein